MSDVAGTIDQITLTDGRMLPVTDVELLGDGWNFKRISSGESLTWKIKQSDKRYYWPNFDVNKTNDEAYKAHTGDTSGPLTTNVTAIMAGQLVTDPLAAPAEMVSNAVDEAKKILTSPMTMIIVVVAIAGLVIYFVPKPK